MGWGQGWQVLVNPALLVTVRPLRLGRVQVRPARQGGAGRQGWADSPRAHLSSTSPAVSPVANGWKEEGRQARPARGP